MSLGQVQLVKWSLPAFALIFGLLWYKRRRVDRVDPGGSSKKSKKANVNAKIQANGNSLDCVTRIGVTSSLCDSGIHTDDSFTSAALLEEIASPRKVSDSLDIPNRISSSQSISMLSCKSVEMNNTPWYADIESDGESTPALRGIQLGSNPSPSGFDYLSKSKSSAELMSMLNIDASIIESVIEEVVATTVTPKVVVAAKSGVSPQTNVEFKECEKQQQQQQPAIEEQQSSGEEKKQSQALLERDSANHSPVSGVLEGSVTDEAWSEGSTDSGKGGSINGYPKDNNRTIYEFAIQSKLVGKLIGRKGRFLQHVRNVTDVGVVVRYHPTECELSVCSIDGSPEGIAAALEMIRQNFPEKAYPQLTLEQMAYDLPVPEEIPWVPELSQLSLVDCVNNDVIISRIIKPNHLFVQIPTHPTYQSLTFLDQNMTQLYNTVESPAVPDELSRGMIVVAKWYNKWVRVYVENPDPNGEQTLVRLVDHGGYWTFSNSEMRKIRSDYLTLPFQAIEVFLANIQPKDGEWRQDAYDVVAQISSGIVGQAQIVGYMGCSTFINLYFSFHNHGIISVADELVARGLAEFVPPVEVVPQEVLPYV